MQEAKKSERNSFKQAEKRASSLQNHLNKLVIEPRVPEHLLAETGLLICYPLTAFRDAEKGELSGSTPVSSHLGHVSNGRVCVCVCDLNRLECIAPYFIQHLHPVCNHCWVDWMQQHPCTPSTWSKSSEAKRFKIPNSRSWRRAEASGVWSGQANSTSDILLFMKLFIFLWTSRNCEMIKMYKITHTSMNIHKLLEDRQKRLCNASNYWRKGKINEIFFFTVLLKMLRNFARKSRKIRMLSEWNRIK